MLNTLAALWSDEVGFIISAELVLVASIVVLSMIVGLHEAVGGVINELADLSDAFGAINQSYHWQGFQSVKSEGQFKSFVAGSRFEDHQDICDNLTGTQSLIACDAPAIGEAIP